MFNLVTSTSDAPLLTQVIPNDYRHAIMRAPLTCKWEAIPLLRRGLVLASLRAVCLRFPIAVRFLKGTVAKKGYQFPAPGHGILITHVYQVAAVIPLKQQIAK